MGRSRYTPPRRPAPPAAEQERLSGWAEASTASTAAREYRYLRGLFNEDAERRQVAATPPGHGADVPHTAPTPVRIAARRCASSVEASHEVGRDAPATEPDSVPEILVNAPTDTELVALARTDLPGIEAVIKKARAKAGLPVLGRHARRKMAHHWRAAAREAHQALKAAGHITGEVVAVTTLDEGVGRLKQLLTGVAMAHLAWAKALAGGNRGALAPGPALAAITTAVGKTDSAVKDLVPLCVQLGMPVLYLTVNGDRRHEVVEKIKALPKRNRSDAYGPADYTWEWFGRTSDPKSPGYCPAMAIVEKLGKKNRMPGVLSCPTCPYGLATMAAKYAAAHDRENRKRVLAKAAALEYGDLSQYEHCSYVVHAELARKGKVLVADYRSYAPALAWLEDMPRLCAQDEDAPLIEQFRADQDEVARWHRQTDPELVAKLTERANDLTAKAKQLASTPAATKKDVRSAKADAKSLTNRVKGLAVGRPRLQRLHDELAMFPHDKAPGTTWPLTPTMREDVEGLTSASTPMVQDHAAPWEHATVEHASGTVWAPLRGLDTLRQAVELDTLRVEVREVRGLKVAELVWEAPTPFCQDLMAKRIHAVMMDATPPPELEKLVEHLDGTVTRIVVAQNLDLTVWRGQFRGRGRKTTAGGEAAVEKAAQEHLEWRCWMADVARRQGASLSHKIRIGAAASSDGIDLDEHPELGWWGRDERGSNAMSYMPLLIDGWQMPPDHGLAKQWAAARAVRILAGADPESIPYWPDSPEGKRVRADWQGGRDIAVGPGQVVHCPILLPTDEAMRAWLIDLCTRDMVQAIGRARAARAAEAVMVWVVGGIPPELWRHGIVVNAVRAMPNNGRHMGNCKQSMDAEDRVAKALRALVDGSAHPTLTNDTIVAKVYELTGIKTSPNTLSKLHRRYGADWYDVLAVLEGRVEAAPGPTPAARVANAWTTMLAEGEPDGPVGRAVLDLLGELVEALADEASEGWPADEQVFARAGP